MLLVVHPCCCPPFLLLPPPVECGDTDHPAASSRVSPLLNGNPNARSFVPPAASQPDRQAASNPQSIDRSIDRSHRPKRPSFAVPPRHAPATVRSASRRRFFLGDESTSTDTLLLHSFHQSAPRSIELIDRSIDSSCQPGHHRPHPCLAWPLAGWFVCLAASSLPTLQTGSDILSLTTHRHKSYHTHSTEPNRRHTNATGTRSRQAGRDFLLSCCMERRRRGSSGSGSGSGMSRSRGKFKRAPMAGHCL